MDRKTYSSFKMIQYFITSNLQHHLPTHPLSILLFFQIEQSLQINFKILRVKLPGDCLVDMEKVGELVNQVHKKYCNKGCMAENFKRKPRMFQSIRAQEASGVNMQKESMVLMFLIEALLESRYLFSSDSGGLQHQKSFCWPFQIFEVSFD